MRPLLVCEVGNADRQLVSCVRLFSCCIFTHCNRKPSFHQYAHLFPVVCCAFQFLCCPRQAPMTKNQG